MAEGISIKEHEFFDDKDEIDVNLDFEHKDFDSKNMIYGYNVSHNIEKKFFFCQDKKWVKDENNKVKGYKDCYRAQYLIGAQWVKIKGKNGKSQTSKAVVISPKFDNIDYSHMFMTCLQSGLASEDFSKLYGIDFDTKDGYISAPSVSSALNLLLLAHFLFLVEKLIKSGLKKDYVYCSENLKKPKGKINIKQNDSRNVIPKRYDRVYCDYSFYSVDIPENRIIKKALLFAKKMISLNDSAASLGRILKKALLTFDGVSDQIQIFEIKQVKSNKLHREYPEVVRLAKMILKKYGYSISNVKNTTEVPPFWIDMAELFERYTLVKLKQKFGNCIEYQFNEDVKFAWRPDFLLIKSDDNDAMILDSKYKQDLHIKLEKDASNEAEIIRQLSGYSRENHIRNKIEAEEGEIVSCVLIYPTDTACKFDNIKFTKEGLNQYSISGLKDFYAVPLEIPMLKGDK